MTSASRITEPRICRRDAPIVRSVANSRTRWATVIESVLKMTKAPTKRAMNPKASRKYAMMFVNSSMSFFASWVSWTPVRTWVFCGQDRLDLLDELLGRDALARGDRDGVELSLLVESR